MIENLIAAVIHLALVAVDLAIIALLVRLVHDRWSRLGSLHRTLEPLSSAVIDTTDRSLHRLGKRPSNSSISVAVSLAAVLIVRFVVTVLLYLMGAG